MINVFDFSSCLRFGELPPGHGYRRLPPKQGKLNRRIQSQSFLQLIGLGAILVQMEKVGPAKGNGELGGFRSTQGGGRFEPAV